MISRKAQIGKFITSVPVLFGLVVLLGGFLSLSIAAAGLKQPAGFGVAEGLLERDTGMFFAQVVVGGEKVFVLDGLLQYAHLHHELVHHGKGRYISDEATRRIGRGVPNAEQGVKDEILAYERFLDGVLGNLPSGNCLVAYLANGWPGVTGTTNFFFLTSGRSGGRTWILEPYYDVPSADLKKKYREVAAPVSVSSEGKDAHFFVYSGRCLS